MIRPVVTAWTTRHSSVSGHAGQYEMREVVNAILYRARTGCQWRHLPHGLRPRARFTATPSGATTAPLRPSTTCCVGRPGKYASGMRTPLPSSWTRRQCGPR
ncbi:transposase [Streptomyces sp. NPDC050549]|uniref:transposase n=1 Tax=Streptomyces sp. NPDC050549 TaxID=3155406 RepID=UPI003420F2AB